MFCIKCGSQIAPGSRFCPVCGNPVHADAEDAYVKTQILNEPYTIPEENSNSDTAYTPPKIEPGRPPRPPKKKLSGGKIAALIIILLFIVIIGLGVTGLILIKTGSKKVVDYLDEGRYKEAVELYKEKVRSIGFLDKLCKNMLKVQFDAKSEDFANGKMKYDEAIEYFSAILKMKVFDKDEITGKMIDAVCGRCDAIRDGTMDYEAWEEYFALVDFGNNCLEGFIYSEPEQHGEITPDEEHPGNYFVKVCAKPGTVLVYENSAGQRQEAEVSKRGYITFTVPVAALLPNEPIESDTLAVTPVIYIKNEEDGTLKQIENIEPVTLDIPTLTLNCENGDSIECENGMCLIKGKIVQTTANVFISAALNGETVISEEALPIAQDGSFEKELKFEATGEYNVLIEAKQNGYKIERINLKAIVTELSDDPNMPVVFRDANFEAAFRSKYNIFGTITRGMVLSFIELDLSECALTDISDVAMFENLQVLTLRKNEISDIEPISALTGLTSLDLFTNKISDISPLFMLTGLTKLNLGVNEITDIWMLSRFTDLVWLNLNYNQIADIGSLAGLTKLEHLNLNDNKITYIGALAQLTNLTWLNLCKCGLDEYTNLASLYNLIWLEELYIRKGNSLTQAQIDTVQSYLPYCIIY